MRATDECVMCGAVMEVYDPDGRPVICDECWRTELMPPNDRCVMCGAPVDPDPRGYQSICYECGRQEFEDEPVEGSAQ